MHYTKPPIVEAVLELRFQTPVDIARARKTADKFQHEYPISEDQENFQVIIGPKGDVGRQSEWAGRKRSNLDATDVLRVSTKSFTTMRLAPYAGWEQLFERTKAQWSKVKKSLGRPKVARIGCRYINRIDIPSNVSPKPNKFDLNDYLLVGPEIPDALNVTLNSFILQATTTPTDDDFPFTIRVGSTPSPLVSHTSFLLDVDVHKDKLSIESDEIIWTTLSRMREHKNKIFESCITDAARGLFS